MRISLRLQITAALVLFGLIPASTVAWFAFRAYDDFKRSQNLLVQQTAVSISDNVASLLKPNPEAIKAAQNGSLPEPERKAIIRVINEVLYQFSIGSAEVHIAKTDNRILVRRKDDGLDPSVTNATFTLAICQRPYGGQEGRQRTGCRLCKPAGIATGRQS